MPMVLLVADENSHYTMGQSISIILWSFYFWETSHMIPAYTHKVPGTCNMSHLTLYLPDPPL